MNIDVKPLVTRTRESKIPFGLALMHTVLVASNRCEAMRLRIGKDFLRLYDAIDVAPTFLLDHSVVLFTSVPYTEDLQEFCSLVEEARREAVQHYRETGEIGKGAVVREDVLHFSIVPWLHFTSLYSPKNYGERAGSVPRITCGKYKECGEEWLLPVSLEAHHGVMDGLQLSQVFDALESLIKGEG